MSKVIVAATPLAGHTVPLLRVADHLSSTGHAVTFLGGRRFGDQAHQAGLRFRSLTGKADYDDRRMAEEFPYTMRLAPGPERLSADIACVFGDPIPDQHAALQDLLVEDPDQLLVTDNTFAGAWPSACGAGLRPRRWIAVGIAPVYARSADTTPFGPAPVDPETDAAQANLAVHDAFAESVRSGYQHVVEIIGSLGGELSSRGWADAAYEMPDLTAQLSVPEFEFPRSDLPDSVRYVGIFPPRVTEWTEPAWWPELDAGHPVVLVTQGTLANGDLSDLVAPTLEGLASEDYLVIAVLGRPVETLLAEPPANARVEEYIPFDRLLPHVDGFVTNGGFGATQQALAAGVPVVVAGTTEDKPAIAARIAYHRVGIDLGTERPTPAQIQDAVRTVRYDPGYRQRVAILAQAYGRYDAQSLISALAREPEPSGSDITTKRISVDR